MVHLKSDDVDVIPDSVEAHAREEPNTTGFWPHSPSFQWWNFTTTVPTSRRSFRFTVEALDDQDGKTSSQIHLNGGNGFSLETDLIPQHQLGCASLFTGSGYVMNVTVAVSFIALYSQSRLADVVCPDHRCAMTPS
jgi:hypothetical protein